ncbi:CHAT domain-containing protein [Ekhidna sp.]|uniref:CHAT domain-containing protein n=1 Tax=Ekhidna sp. TaxID=2608089 RepID=UPI003299B63E
MSKRTSTLLSFIFIAFLTSFGQNNESDSIKIESLISQANDHLYTSQYDSSYNKINEALKLAYNSKLWHQYYKAQLKQSEVFWRQGLFDEAMSISKNALEDAERDLKTNPVIIASFNQQIGTIHMLAGSSDSTLIYYDKAVALLPDTKEGWVEKAAIFANMAYLYNRKGQTNRQIFYAEKAYEMDLNIYEKDHVYLAEDLLNIGTALISLSLYEEAEVKLNDALSILLRLNRKGQVYSMVSQSLGVTFTKLQQYEKALEFLNQSLVNDLRLNGNVTLTSIYGNLGAIYLSMDNPDSSIYFLTKQLDLIETKEQNAFSNIINIRDLATAYAIKGEMKKAESLLNDALHFAKANFETLEGEGIVYHDLGYVYWIGKEYERAESFYLKSIEVFSRDPDLRTLEIIAHENLGTLYMDWGKSMKALNSYQKALALNAPAWSYQNIFESPSLEEVTSVSSLFNVLIGKVEVMSSIWDNNSVSEDDLLHMISTFKLLDKIIRSRRSGIDRLQDKIEFLQYAHRVYELAIGLNLKLFYQTKNKDFLAWCYYYSEADKSTILSESTNRLNVNRISNVPHELLKEEESLKVDQAYLRSQLASLKKQDSLDQQLIKDNRRLFAKTNQSLDSINSIIREEHPDFFTLRYKREILPAEDIQLSLPSSAVFLEYFIGDSMSYAILLSKNDIDVVELGRSTEIKLLIREFHNSVKQTDLDIREGFYDRSLALYQKILDPFSSKLSNCKIIIVASGGELGIIPFDLLITENFQEDMAISEIPYLLKKYVIQNVNSASIEFSAAKKDKNNTEGLICFAPSYKSSSPQNISRFRSSISELRWNQIEVENIQNALGSENYLGESATESQFKELAKGRKVIHLAMHAFVDNEDPMNSKLVFTNVNDSIEDNLLHTFELFNMKLDADLAVLSACETGYGKVVKGDGIMSLASGFAYAGVPSVVMSHWQVDDQSTSILMGYFYEFLSKGLSNSEALRRAKLKYLETTSPEKIHPFYWGSFVVIGDDTPVFKRTYYHYIIILVFICLFLLFINKRRKGT